MVYCLQAIRSDEVIANLREIRRQIFEEEYEGGKSRMAAAGAGRTCGGQLARCQVNATWQK